MLRSGILLGSMGEKLHFMYDPEFLIMKITELSINFISCGDQY